MIAGGKTERDTVNVAVVDNEDSVISRILIHTVSEMEYVRPLLSVETMDEASAEAAIGDGTCAAAIVLPSDFLNDIAHGERTKGRILLSSSVAAQGDMIASTARFGERLLVSGQYGVFAGERLLRERHAEAAVYEGYLAAANTSLIASVMTGSESYFSEECVSYENSGLTFEGYFTLCWLTAFLFLLTLFFMPLFTRDCTRGVLSRLASYKIGRVRFMLWKIVLLTLFRYVLLLVALFALRGVTDVRIDLITPLAASFYITAVGACLTVCTGDGITANAAVTLVGMLLCGGLVPLHLLPDGVRLLGRMTPFGAAASLLEPLFGASVDPVGIGCAALYTALSVILIGTRLNRVLAGRCE